MKRFQGLAGFACLMLLGALEALPAQAAPDEEILGKAEGYPIGTPRSWFFEQRVRVGSFSNLDRILPHNTMARAAKASPLPTAPAPPVLRYRFQGQTLGLDDFLAHQRITGLLIIREGRILAERYQYERTAAHRFVSNSMSKSIVSIAIGMLQAEGKIKSLDDTAARYEPRLAGSAYGETSIRHLLRMASGVRFVEAYDGRDDLARFVRLRTQESTIAALSAFANREVEAGSRFHYATSETVALTMVARAAAGSSLSAYLGQRLWSAIGAEADATWITARDGTEIGGGSFNAVLRDYGRLGLLLANDGRVGEGPGARQVIPRDYLIEATDWHRQPPAFAPRKATPYFGYGYQFWTYPGAKRRFAMLGVFGQSIFVDPELKLVLVLTAAAANASVGKETLARERDALWRGLVSHFGAW